MSRAKRLLLWMAVIVVVASAGLYASLFHSISKRGPIHLVACIEVEPAVLSWTCEQALRRVALTPQAVDRLNADAGARYPLAVTDPHKAEELLELFLVRGVDINAGEQQAAGWTALHMSAMTGDVVAARLLLKHGADPTIRDANGDTALDIARRRNAKHPSATAHARMLQLLQNAGSPQLP